MRNNIFKRLKKSEDEEDKLINDIEAIIPQEGIEEMARKLPTTVEEFDPANLKNIPQKQLER